MGDQPETADSGPDPDDRLSKLAALFGADGPPDLDEVEAPLHWPDLTAEDAPAEWDELRSWVERSLERFPHLDHHVIPLCWWRHNGHVEGLAALRDHERICYADSSPATAAVDWHRAFRDIESRLREWTGVLPCGSTHDPRVPSLRPLDQGQWATFVARDVEERRQSAIRHAVRDE